MVLELEVAAVMLEAAVVCASPRAVACGALERDWEEEESLGSGGGLGESPRMIQTSFLWTDDVDGRGRMVVALAGGAEGRVEWLALPRIEISGISSSELEL